MKKMFKDKGAAMEMSVGTIVTIVLLMSVLVLGVFLVQRIFDSGSDAIEGIDTQIQSEINKLFSEEGKPLVIFPSSRQITIKRGDDTLKGFAFSVENSDTTLHNYEYTIEAQDATQCGSSLNEEKATRYLMPSEGSFKLGAGQKLTNAELVKLNVPKSAPPCSIMYRVTVTQTEDNQIESATVFVTLK